MTHLIKFEWFYTSREETSWKTMVAENLFKRRFFDCPREWKDRGKEKNEDGDTKTSCQRHGLRVESTMRCLDNDFTLEAFALFKVLSLRLGALITKTHAVRISRSRLLYFKKIVFKQIRLILIGRVWVIECSLIARGATILDPFLMPRTTLKAYIMRKLSHFWFLKRFLIVVFINVYLFLKEVLMFIIFFYFFWSSNVYYYFYYLINVLNLFQNIFIK